MGLYPRNYNEYIASLGIPRGANSQVYLVDPDNGVAGRDGKTLETTLPTVQEAFALCTTDEHDVVMMISNDSASELVGAIAWNKDFTHLIGLSSNLNGVGQRCRITASTVEDLGQLVTFSGKGCIVRNIQFYNGTDADVDSGAVIVSGDRNEFTNCFFAGMAHTTPAARAGSYSLTLSGEENEFNNCTFGLDTVVRAAANAELVIATGAARTLFDNCRFQSASETAGKFLVAITGMDRWVEFKDCIFSNFSVNWGNTLTNAFKIAEAATHNVYLRGGNMLAGVDGWADVVTHIYSAEPVPNAGFGIAVAPTT